jgi:hypothetical protein
MSPEEKEKCIGCRNLALKRTAYCILHCQGYDKFEKKVSLKQLDLFHQAGDEVNCKKGRNN